MSDFTKEQLIERAKMRLVMVAAFPDSQLAQMDKCLAEIALATLEAENAEKKPILSQAVADIIAERQRQIAVERWTPEHDDEHSRGELAAAAACYALLANQQGFSTPAHWPWSPDWWKQTSERNDLIKAGALITAEIERIDRAQQRAGEAL